jgi:L-ascorbate metabolism protein UlaG (beta-lactamase superfamily)
MTVEITWLSHSAFEIQTDKYNLMIDPFLTDNPAAKVQAADVKPNFILITHGHFDHIGDTVDIAKRTGATCIGIYDLTTWLEKQGVKNTHGMNLGGKFKFDFGTVKMTPAWHSAQLPDGSYGGSPAGLLITIDGFTIFHAGDTALFTDMQLIGEEGIDLAIIPIGDNYTMGPEDSLRAIKFLNPKMVAPCHYNTWPPINQNAATWSEEVKSHTSAEPIIFEVGQTRKFA